MKPWLHGQLTGQEALLIVHPMPYKRGYCIPLTRIDQVSVQISSAGAGLHEQAGNVMGETV